MQVTGTINLQAWMSDPETWAIMDALVQEEGEALFVGGCVRDSILNRPVYDVDIATILKPEEVMVRMKNADITVIPTGIDHGTVTAIVDEKPFEITTLRCDVTTDGRHAEVTYTDDYIEDAKRRDFTMNAIFCDLEGNLYDPFGGVQDLHQGIIRFVGNPEERITEDVLRILRYYRFLAGFGKGDPMPEAVAATQKLAHLIPNLSAERIQTETMKLLEAKYADQVIAFLIEKDILKYWLPALSKSDVLTNLMQLETELENKSFPVRRMAALCPMNGEAAKETAKALKLSNKDRNDLIALTTEMADFELDADLKTWRRLTHIHGTDFLRNYILLSAARAGDVEMAKTAYDIVTKIRLPDFQIRGKDIINLGVPAGPEIGTYMRAVETWWIDQDFEPKRRACLDYLESIIETETA